MWTRSGRAAICLLSGAVLACTDAPTDPVPTDGQLAAGLNIGGYSIYDLGLPLGHTDGAARAINDQGDLIVGESWGPGGGGATMWPVDGEPFPLGALPGHTSSSAYGVNDSGQIVGASVGPTMEAFLYTLDAGMVSIHDPALFTESQANAINNAGVVVGFGITPGGDVRAFTWTAVHGMRLLKGYGETEAKDINDKGTIVGRILGDDELGVVWHSKGTSLIGTLGGSISVASGVNDAGVVIGWSQLDDFFTTHAFSYHPGFAPWAPPLADLGPSTSFYALARKISNRGRIVGVDESTGNAITTTRKTWDQLPDHGWTADAFDVSRCGTIVGFAFTAFGAEQLPVRWHKMSSDCP